MRVTFRSGAIQLEGDLVAQAGCTRGAVICHPHPQYGGDMNNGVVCSITDALGDAGFATLRFNFRGVGRSGGTYDDGVGEVEDARAAARFVSERIPVTQVTLAGYSFGATVALRGGIPVGEVEAIIAVAPPLGFSDLANAAQCAKPKLFVVGDRDQFCDVAELQTQVAAMAEPKMLHVLKGADHFFFGHEQEVADAVRQWVTVACGHVPASRS